MSVNCPYEIVDVFAPAAYLGNPLAVVTTRQPLADAVMRQIAHEMNLSETTFFAPHRDATGVYRVRIYTPAKEIPFAGHPILGTAWVIRQHFERESKLVRLGLDVGVIDVSFEQMAKFGDTAWFKAPKTEFGAGCAPELIANALGISVDDMDPEFPVVQVTGGVTIVLAPLRSEDALRRARLDLSRFGPLAAIGVPPMVYIFCRKENGRRNELRARFFFEAFGIREDPASGNAAAFLGSYMLKHDYLGGDVELAFIEQGLEVGRPSLVMLRAAKTAGGRDIHVGGQVVRTARGELV